ncbi:MAG: hypothetical protein JRJ87_20515 [Deltaproteobacteria bacterium]|nr:hypothetical protein [Deltaproteobacteria bacterium]
MRRTSRINSSKICLALLLGAIMVVSGCSSSNGGQDAGPSDGDGTNGSDDDGANGSDDGANGSDDGGQNGDFDGWVINIPAGLSFCQWNALGSKSAPYENFEGKIRIFIKEASINWPENQESLELDLIERVEISPEGLPAESRGPGTLRAIRQGGNGTEWLIFSYSQDYGLGAEDFNASFSFHIVMPLASQQIDVADFLTADHNTCQARADQAQAKVTAEAANGDVIEFEYYYILSFTCPPGMACLTPYGLGDISKAVFTSGADVRSVENYFRYGLSCGHHEGPKRFMVFFEQALGDIRGVELAPEIQGGINYKLTYLGQNLAVIATEDVVDISWD